MTVKELRDILNRLGKECDDYIVTRPKPQWKTGPGFGYDEHYKGDIYVGEENRPASYASLHSSNETFNID